jgi:LysM repeat protein
MENFKALILQCLKSLLMKKFVFLFLCVTLSLTTPLYAQTNYTTHTIQKGETLSILAQKYHTTVGDIMRLNGMTGKSQLKTGEKIKIPSGNVSATTKKATKTTPSKTTAIPAADTTVETHYVLQGETLFSISKKFGVTIEQLKEWNHLNDDNIHFGQRLAVREAGNRVTASGVTTATQTDEQNGTQAPRKDSGIIVDKETISANEQTTPPARDTTETMMENKTHTATNDNPPLAPTTETNAAPPADTKSENTVQVGSYFEKDAAAISEKSMSGDARTFKTATGWTDKKYYILANGIPAGSVVRVSGNGRSIYAKVLWGLDDTKTNNGLSFRISDAAALALGLYMPEFNLTVTY